MTTNTADLILGVTLQDKASKGISGIGDAFDKLGSQIGGDMGELVSNVGDGFNTIADAGKSMGLKLAAVGAGVAALGVGLQSFASKDQQAQNQLKAAIDATGNSWDDYEGQVEHAIKTGENFAHTADETQNALAALTEATGDPTKALQYLSVVFNLAAAKHEDLTTAADQVAKALSGNAKLFTQYGIAMDGVGEKTDQAARATDQLGQKLGGQASASVDTFTGKLDVLKAKAGDFVSSFAGPVGSSIANFGTALTALVLVYEISAPLAVKLATAIRGVGVAADIETVSVAASTVALEANTVAEIAAGDAALGTATKFKSAAGLLAAGSALGGASIAESLGSGKLQEIGRQTSDNIAAQEVALGRLKQAQKLVTDQAKEYGIAQQDIAKKFPEYTAALANIDTKTVDLSDHTQVLAERYTNLAAGAGILDDRNRHLSIATKLLDSDTVKLSDRNKNLALQTRVLDDRNKGLSISTGILADKYAILDDRNSVLAKSTAEMADRNSTWSISTDLIARSAAQLTDRNANLSVGIKKLAGVVGDLGDRNSNLALQATSLNDRNSGLSITTGKLAGVDDDWAAAAKRVNDQLNLQIPTLDSLYGKVENAYLASHKFADAQKTVPAILKGVKDGTLSTNDAFAAFVGIANDAKDAQSSASKKDATYRGELDKLRDSTKKGSPLYVALSQFIAQLDNAARTRTATLLLKINAQQNQGEHHQGDVRGPPTATGGIFKHRPGGYQRTVGEGSNDEAVIPLPKNGGLGALGGNTYNLTFNTDGGALDPQAVVRAIQQFERRNTSRWRAA